jgi:hypothetical protein
MRVTSTAPSRCDPYTCPITRSIGVIVTDSEEEQVDRFMLPARRRWMALMDMLQFLVSSIANALWLLLWQDVLCSCLHLTCCVPEVRAEAA